MTREQKLEQALRDLLEHNDAVYQTEYDGRMLTCCIGCDADLAVADHAKDCPVVRAQATLAAGVAEAPAGGYPQRWKFPGVPVDPQPPEPPGVTATPAPQPAGITKEQLQQWHDYMGSLMQQAGVQSSEVIGDLYRAYLEAPTNGVIASDGSRRG
jgi:hypothetical protein